MVAMSVSFGATTPHGGPPFQGWKKGFGFGHAVGPGQYYKDPSCPAVLRFTPKGDRGLASNPFWRKKFEIGQASGFGFGDRPDYTPKESANGNISPDNYGDVAPLLNKSKRNATRAGITMKPYFDTFETKKRASSTEGGPGPGKYNTSIPTGQSSWCYPSKVSSWSMLPRPANSKADLAGMETPGPGDYETRIDGGKNAPYKHGTLYDIAMKGRGNVAQGRPGLESPGPARYQVLGELDHYTLGTMIANAKVGRTQLPKSHSSPTIRRGGAAGATIGSGGAAAGSLATAAASIVTSAAPALEREFDAEHRRAEGD